MFSNSIKSLDDFFFLDESQRIGRFIDNKTKIPYWFLIRNSVLRTLVNKQLGSNITGVKVRTFHKLFKMSLVYCLQFPMNLLSVLLMFFSNRDVLLITRSESYSNPKRAIYTEYLIERLGIPSSRVVSIETDETSAEIFRNNMIVFKSSSIKHFLSFICIFINKLTKNESIDNFMIALSDELSIMDSKHRLTEKELSVLKRELGIRLIRNKIMNLIYRAFLSILKPKLVIFEEGFYQHSMLLNKLCSEKNIATVEMQHGVVHPNHDAYNYSDSIVANERFKDFFPDLLLTWGKFWEQNIRIPTKAISIGFPYRSSQLRKTVFRTNKRMLILGDGANTGKYVSLCEELAKNNRLAYQVIFRPHPMEKVLFESNSEYTRYLSNAQVLVDLDRNLYDSLGNSSVIISEMSTCLFEAIGLVDRTLVWRTGVSEFAFRTLPFEDFSSIEDLVSRLEQSATPCEICNVGDFWTKDCEINGVEGLLKEVLTF